MTILMGAILSALGLLTTWGGMTGRMAAMIGGEINPNLLTGSGNSSGGSSSGPNLLTGSGNSSGGSSSGSGTAPDPTGLTGQFAQNLGRNIGDVVTVPVQIWDKAHNVTTDILKILGL